MAARISKADFDEKVLKSKLPVIVDFYSDSCVACKKLAPVLGDIEDDYEDKLHVYKVNTNFDGELADEYEVTANPTLLFIKDAEVLDRKVGAQKPADLKAWENMSGEFWIGNINQNRNIGNSGKHTRRRPFCLPGLKGRN